MKIMKLAEWRSGYIEIINYKCQLWRNNGIANQAKTSGEIRLMSALNGNEAAAAVCGVA
jgi:hypothetical protein